MDSGSSRLQLMILWDGRHHKRPENEGNDGALLFVVLTFAFVAVVVIGQLWRAS